VEGHTVHNNGRQGCQIGNNFPICTLFMIIRVNLPMMIVCCLTWVYTNSEPSIKPPDLARWTTVSLLETFTSAVIPITSLFCQHFLTSNWHPPKFHPGTKLAYPSHYISLFAVRKHFSSSQYSPFQLIVFHLKPIFSNTHLTIVTFNSK
jgi:hypothetical protein